MTGRSIALVGSGGSSGRTLAIVEAALRARLGDIAVRFIDTQPFNLRTGGRTAYDGGGEVRVASMAAAGLRRYTGSWSTNMLLNGGPMMTRRLARHARDLLGGRHDAMILCHDRIYIETALIGAARASGTPTVLVQEGPFCAIGSPAPQTWRLRAKAALAPIVTATGLLPVMPDYGCAGHELITAVSDAYRARWIAAGVPGERIAVTGVPRYDRLAGLRGEFSGTGDVLRLLYIVQPFAAHGKVDGQEAARLQAVLADGINRAATERPIAVTVRMHPRSGGADAAVLTGGLAGAYVVDDGAAPLEDAVMRHDLIVGHYSSGLLESVLLGRPVLCLPVAAAAFAEASEAEKQAWLVRTGVAVADTAERVAAVLMGGVRGVIDRALIAEETGVVDGGAAARCAEAVAGVMVA
ncbi:hypothetical protein [Sphingomonas prati]|uniref:Polysaccharide pyruvyl transferase domain-containing protein n=1 Tax=Sphingomonas prati TaxID=1843237 RepID=A0A7W9F1G2_9SPHN|nr:hypothetical protein [Sphingomonas prati]MBB5729226.1 hypothetical protein [Sphingomonas prati]